MEKEIKIGRIKGECYGLKQSLLVTVEIELKEVAEGLRLSVCGNIWNSRRTDIISGGQNRDTIRQHLLNDEFKELYVSRGDLVTLFTLWEHWHLNDLRAGCVHQRELLSKHLDWPRDYTKLIERPEFKKCPECGYAYGSKWLYEPLPSDVVQFIKSFGGF